MQKIGIRVNAKINLSLSVLSKRDDGYHNLSLINQSIELFDEVWISSNDKGMICITSNADIPLDCANSAYKACDFFCKKSTIPAGFDIHIQKNIPQMGGLGGSSADAAAVLFGLNDFYQMFAEKELNDMAAGIGADVPFMLYGGAAKCTGIGENIESLDTFIKSPILLAKPPLGVSAGWAYGQIDKITSPTKGTDGNKDMIDAMKSRDEEAVFSLLHNDLESAVVSKFPMIRQLQEDLKAAGAKATLMSGSGSTSYGFFSRDGDMEGIRESMARTYPDCEFIITRAVPFGCRRLEI